MLSLLQPRATLPCLAWARAIGLWACVARILACSHMHCLMNASPAATCKCSPCSKLHASALSSISSLLPSRLHCSLLSTRQSPKLLHCPQKGLRLGACAALVLGQWLSLRLQSLSAVLVVAVALLGTLQNHRLLPPFLSMITKWAPAGTILDTLLVGAMGVC